MRAGMIVTANSKRNGRNAPLELLFELLTQIVQSKPKVGPNPLRFAPLGLVYRNGIEAVNNRTHFVSLSD